MSKNKKIRIGMIGYQFMGKAHSHAYRDLPFYFHMEVEPVLQTIVGRDAHAVEAAARKMGWVSFETEWEKLIAREDIDVIDIVTPNYLHADIAMAAAAAGKHVICEKPLSMNVEQAKNMLHAVRRAHVNHMICFNYRFAPAVQYAKTLIDEGVLGTIYHVRAKYLQDWIMNPQFPLVWRLQKHTSGSGVHGDLMAHSIDLARFLLGDEISEVSGMMETFIKRRPVQEGIDGPDGSVDVDDAVAFLARFRNGALGVFEATRFANGHRCSNQIEINGSKGSIRWDFERMNHLELYLAEDRRGMQGFRTIHCTEEMHPFASGYWPPGHSIGYEHTFINLLSEFFRGITQGTSPSPNFEDGLQNQMVLEAVEQSAVLKQWVKVEKHGIK